MSLTYTAYAGRRMIKYGGIFLIIFVILWSVGSVAIEMYKTTHPKYIAPTVKYGILPKIIFPEKQFEKKNFSLEFTNDQIPNFGDQSKVYIIYRPVTKILALERGKELAKKFGFEDEPIEIEEGVYRFKNNLSNMTLTMNVLESNFKMTYPYLEDKTILEVKYMPTKAKAIEMASAFLTSGEKYTDDLKNGEKKVSYWKIADGALKPVLAQSESNVIKVDFYRQKLENKFEITSTKLGEASVSVLVSGANSFSKDIVGASFKYVNIDRESFSTYPIKTTEQAIADLKSGNYWPSSDVENKDVIIRSVDLVYYEPVTLTQYVQPMFVFKGDGGFVAFVPAVVNNYLQNN